jgi:DNA-binding response OmpR family regulator
MQPTILIVEDDPIAANLVQLILGRQGYRSLVALDGLEGLKIARSEHIDLILLDLMLPGIDGFEVLTQLRAAPKTEDIPVMIVSVKSQVADRRTAAKVGADAYLTKPYKAEDLVAKVNSLLRGEVETIAPQAPCMMLVGTHRRDVARAALYTGLALNGNNVAVTLIDLYPLSTDYSVLLGLPPHQSPILLADPGTTNHLADVIAYHSSGLGLLNNLQGRGQAGQLTFKDINALLTALSPEETFALADLPPDYPTEVLCQLASCSALVLLVTRDDPTSMQKTRAALTLMERSEVGGGNIIVMVIGPAPQEDIQAFEREGLHVIQAETTPDHPAFRDLAARAKDALQSTREGDS